jgi:beta-glucosidase
VVQLYTRQQRSRVKQPLRQLRGFQRIALAPGERRTVHFTLAAADLAYWDVTQDRFVVEAARHTVMVGGSSADIRRTAVVAVRGDQVPPRDVLAGPLAAVNHDEYDGVILFDESPTGGDAVGAAEAGAWISFADVAFDGPLAAVRIRVSRVDMGRAVVTLRLDDPIAGPVVAEVREDCGPDRHAWHDVVVPVTPDLSGRHDLYVVLAEPGVNLASVTFFGSAA